MRFLIPVCLFFVCNAQGQGYKTGATISDFGNSKIINNGVAGNTFNLATADITILDFFGTWCAPCIRALPVLADLQSKFNNVQVLLISTESENQLQKFVSARMPFPFPVMVDSAERVSALFMPPGYPYTVVLNKANKIIAITEAAEINDSLMQSWLAIVPGAEPPSVKIKQAPVVESEIKMSNSTVTLSEKFIYAAKTGSATKELEQSLQNLTWQELAKDLSTDAEKMAFWINLYNGFTQLRLKADPELYKNRNKFFKARKIGVAGRQFSLDEIEHDILRRSKIKWSLGYLNKIFPGETFKLLRVKALDPRIHFTLNCGAKSCPPIAFYQAQRIDEQLEIATKAYLLSEAIYDTAGNKVQLPAIMGWFRRDFKGKAGMVRLLHRVGIVPENVKPKISFRKYDWQIYLDNYKK